jgi:succinate dehydrogenase/fumarate reductase-like Fe-S protein
MAATGRALAWLNLAWRFGRHVLVRMPGRVVRGSADMQRFLDEVVPEGYTPMAAEDRELLPSVMNCINCGLCSLACPTLREAPASAWAGTWTFVAGPSRSIDRAALVLADATPCAACDDCAAVCPTGVPIPQLAGLVRRMAAPVQASPDVPPVPVSQS